MGVEQFFTTLFVGRRAGMQGPIRDETDTPKGVSKNTRLLIGWIESELVGTLRQAHALFSFLAFNILLDGFKRDPASCAHIVAIGPHAGDLLLEFWKLLTQS